MCSTAHREFRETYVDLINNSDKISEIRASNKPQKLKYSYNSLNQLNMKANLLSLLFFLIITVSVKAQTVTMYLLELESHTRWEAVDSKWNKLREEWVSSCKAEKSSEKSAQLLLQFESNVKWDAVETNWSKRRNDWVNECNKASSSEQVAKLLLEFEPNIKWSAVDEKWKTRRSDWVNELNTMAKGLNTKGSR